jgi:GNAT superfamily N-acetyltransferase
MNWSLRYANDNKYTIENGSSQISQINQELGGHAAAEGFSIIKRLVDGKIPDDLLVAKHGKKIIGVGGIKPCDRVPGASRVSQFYVHPDYRRSGVAKSLATSLISNAPTSTITCESHETARPFWESMGFKPVDNLGEVTHILDKR